jgi:hypothetical protein
MANFWARTIGHLGCTVELLFEIIGIEVSYNCGGLVPCRSIAFLKHCMHGHVMGAHIVVSLGEVILRIVLELKSFVIADEGVPIVSKVKLLVGTTCNENQNM